VREIRNIFNMAKGSRRGAIGFLQLILGPFTRTSRALRPRLESRSWGTIGSFTRDRKANHGELSALYSRSRTQIYKRKPISRKSWTRILVDHSRARRAPAPFARSPSPSPARPGPAQRGERARVLPSSSHPHLQEHGEHPTI
jgi:hypothetical protein